MTNSWTKAQMLDVLNTAVEEVDSKLTKDRYENWRTPKQPSADAVVDRFNSWTAALTEAGKKSKAQKWTDDDLLDILREAIDAHDVRLTMPRFIEWASEDHPNPWIYYERFGSWKKALSKVGGFRRGDELKREQAVRWLQACAVECGDVTQSSYSVWKPKEAYGVDLIASVFGSWTGALKAAGLDVVSTPTQWSDEQTIAALQRWDRDRDPSLPATRTAYGRWRDKQRNSKSLPPYRSVALNAVKYPPKKAWEHACEEAGIETPRHRVHAQFTDKDLTRFMKQATSDVGHHPSAQEYGRWAEKRKRKGMPVASKSTMMRRHGGSWADVPRTGRI